MSFAIVAAGVGVASAGYSLYKGVKKSAQAKKLAATNVRPVFNADGSIKEVRNLALNEYNSNYERDFTSQELHQNQMEGIDAILKSGGKADFDTIQGTFGKGLQQGLNQIMMGRDRKIANLNNAQYAFAQSKDTEFQYNQDAPFKDTKQQEAALRQESQQEIADGISGIASSVSNYGVSTTKPGNYGKTGKVSPEQAPKATAAAWRTPASNTMTGPPAWVLNAAKPPVPPPHTENYNMHTPPEGYVTGYDPYGDPIYSGG